MPLNILKSVTILMERKNGKQSKKSNTNKCNLEPISRSIQLVPSPLPFVLGSAAPFIANNVFSRVTNYTVTNGGLGSYFDPITGIFTARTKGIYLFSFNVIFQIGDPHTSNPNTVSTDGDRLMRLVASGLNTAFYGQYHFVANDSEISNRSAFVLLTPPPLMAFEDSLSINITLIMQAGDTAHLSVYQNNKFYLAPVSTTPPIPTGGISQYAFTDFAITKISDIGIFLPASIPQSTNLNANLDNSRVPNGIIV